MQGKNIAGGAGSTRQADPSLSLIIPAYNEATRIAGTIREAVAWLTGQPFATEARLSWNARGVEHEKTVHLSSVVPGNNAVGTLIITVYDNKLAARFEAGPEIPK